MLNTARPHAKTEQYEAAGRNRMDRLITLLSRLACPTSVVRV